MSILLALDHKTDAGSDPFTWVRSLSEEPGGCLSVRTAPTV